MVTELAILVHGHLRESEHAYLSQLDKPDTRIEWPGQPRKVWPKADVSARLATGDVLIVEIDEHQNPERNIVKYWPLVHAAAEEGFDFPRILFVEVSSPDATFGAGYDRLARFVGERLQQMYPLKFRFRYVQLKGKDPSEICADIIEFIGHEGEVSRQTDGEGE